MSTYNQESTYPTESAFSPLTLVIPTVAVLGALFALSRRNSGGKNNIVETVVKQAKQTSKVGQDAQKKGGSFTQRAGLTMLINILENDASRRVVITVLKFMRARA